MGSRGPQIEGNRGYCGETGEDGGGPAGRGEAGLAFPPRGLMAAGGPARQEGVSRDPAHPLYWEV